MSNSSSKIQSNDCHFLNLPIPKSKEKKTALNYGQIEFDTSHGLYDDPLVEAKEYGIAQNSYYARADGFNPPYYKSFGKARIDIYVRKAVAIKLAEVNKSLASKQLELCLLDGWRSIPLQKELWEHFLDRAKTTLINPSEDECIEYAGEFCSNPSAFKQDDCTTWPTHSTGGAIDLLLRSTITKEPLFFGSVFDDANPISYTNHFEINQPTSSSEVEAQRNRRLLYWSMVNAGFANYPLEWWHFDLGTQMWVMNSDENNSKAYYGYTELQ